MLKNRRDFLKGCAASASALVFTNRLDAEKIEESAAYRTPDSLERYIDALRVPQRLPLETTRNGEVQCRVRMLEFHQQLHSQLPPTKLWGYEGQYPGPTIEAWRGRPIVVQWENHLPTSHLFEVDPHIHGAMPPSPAVRTVPHLHGSRTRSESDGLPEKWFTPGSSARYFYPNNQQAATLWYHDHAVGITRLNVYAGLSVFFFCGMTKSARWTCLQVTMKFHFCFRTARWITRVGLSIRQQWKMARNFLPAFGGRSSLANFLL